MKIRVKMDFVIDTARGCHLSRDTSILDVIEPAARKLGAIEILPGSKLSLTTVKRPRPIADSGDHRKRRRKPTK